MIGKLCCQSRIVGLVEGVGGVIQLLKKDPRGRGSWEERAGLGWVGGQRTW